MPRPSGTRPSTPCSAPSAPRVCPELGTAASVVSAVLVAGSFLIAGTRTLAAGQTASPREIPPPAATPGPPGPPLSAADAEAILNAAASAARDGWIVGCGSLPPGAPRDFYARLARLATRDRRVAVDASGDALATAVTAGIGLVKPNRQELEELVRRPLATLGAVLDAARALVAQGCGAALVSLGSDGALFVDAVSAAHAEARIADAVNTVGAGDALLAGFLAAGARAEALPVAVAWAVAAVRSPGTRMRPVTEADRAAVIVNEPLDLARRLVA